MGGRFALMWSGGKDSALALDRACRAGMEVTRLLTFYDSATQRVRFHATRVVGWTVATNLESLVRGRHSHLRVF